MSERDRERRKYGMRVRATETGSLAERGRGWETETTREGNVATLLIENSSALAILIKSRKSLARSIGQTGKARSVRSPFGNGHSQCPHFTLFPPFALWLSFYYLKYLNRSSRKRQINHISYDGLGIPFFFLMKHWLKIFKSYLIYYNFCHNRKRERILFLPLTNFSF